MNESLTIQQIFRVLLKKWWIILISVIVCGSVAFAYSTYVVAPQYTSIGTLIVNNKQSKEATAININDINASQKLVNTYAIILKSNAFVNRVKEKINLDYTVSQIQSMVTYSSVNNTEVLAVSVVSENPEHSAVIAETVLDLATEEIGKYAEVGSVKILDHANLPVSPSSPNIPLNTLIGILLGAILSVLMIFVTEMMDTRIKSADDLGDRYSLPVLGVIPSAEHKEENKNDKTVS